MIASLLTLTVFNYRLKNKQKHLHTSGLLTKILNLLQRSTKSAPVAFLEQWINVNRLIICSIFYMIARKIDI